EELRQGTRPRRHPRRRPAGRGPHRRRARARRLEDRLGPHRLRRLPRRPDDPADHLAGLRLRARRTPRPRPGPPDAPRPRSRPRRPPPRAGLLLQGPGRGRLLGTRRAVRRAAGLRGPAAGRHMSSTSTSTGDTSTLRAWAELLRLPALFSVPGDALAGAAAIGVRPGRGTLLAIGSSLCLYEA